MDWNRDTVDRRQQCSGTALRGRTVLIGSHYDYAEGQKCNEEHLLASTKICPWGSSKRHPGETFQSAMHAKASAFTAEYAPLMGVTVSSAQCRGPLCSTGA
jgi:hypothetical protein